jgi:hypothetical protein
MTITLPTYALRIESDWLSAMREAVALDHFRHPFIVWFSLLYNTILVCVCIYIYILYISRKKMLERVR